MPVKKKVGVKKLKNGPKSGREKEKLPVKMKKVGVKKLKNGPKSGREKGKMPVKKFKKRPPK